MLANFGLPSSDMGIAIALFQPAAYADVTGIRRVHNKTNRILVWSAGLLIQFILLAIKLFFLFLLELQNNYLFDFLMVSVISNILLIFMNILFAFRFDGYHILKEILSNETLREDSMQYIRNSTNEIYRDLSIYKKCIFMMIGILSISFPIILPILTISVFLPNFFPFLNPLIEITFPFAILGVLIFIFIRHKLRVRNFERRSSN